MEIGIGDAATPGAAALDTWNDGPAAQAIIEFVAKVCGDGPEGLPPEERVAVFDNDGTLWCEKPMPIQLDFTVRRLAQLAEEDSSLRGKQPYRAALDHDLHWLGAAMVKHYHGDDEDLHLLLDSVTRAFDTVTVEQYDAQVREFFAEATHPTLHLPYRSVGYTPMVQLLHYLREHDFVCYIASGGDRDFMRPVAADLYGIPPERIIGSALGLTFDEHGDRPALMYKAAMDFFDDGKEKPIRIWSRIGRRPILAAGNSNGDLQMFEFAGTSSATGLRLLILHDDADREFADTGGAETVLARARAKGWTVVSMKNDWRTVFGPGTR